MSSEQEMISVYVLPSEPYKPARALLYKTPAGQEEEEMLGPPTGGFEGTIVTWSQDVGTWITAEGVPLPEDLGNVITEHAKSLGVEAFLD